MHKERKADVVFVAIIVIILLMLSQTALAHSRPEMDDWMEGWVEQADHALSPGLLFELNDMTERHPWYFNVPRLYMTPRASRVWSGNVEQWRPLVETYFAPEKVATAMCLINAETGGTGDPNIDNRQGSSAAGLFQFLKSTWNSVPLSITGGTYESGQVYDPEANIRSAAWLQNRYGWTQWSPYKAGKCREETPWPRKSRLDRINDTICRIV